MASQTSVDLRPYVKVKSSINFTAVSNPTNVVGIIGFVDDIATLDASARVGEPLDVGYVTSVSRAVTICDSLGLRYKFLTSTTLDMADTDPIAGQLINFAIAFENYGALGQEQVLSNCAIVLCILDPTVSSKTVSPFANFFTLVKEQSTVMDTIVCPYEYVSGDSTTAGNYYEEITLFSASRWNNSEPVYGHNHIIMANVTWRKTDITPPDSANSEHLTVLLHPQDTTATTYQLSAEQVASMYAILLTGIQRPYNGFFGQRLATIPAPADKALIFGDDTISTLNSWGFSVLNTNGRTNVVSASRILVTLLADPTTNIARDFMLDFQSWRANYDFKNSLYQRLIAGKIINEKFTVNSSGSSRINGTVVAIMFAEAVRFSSLQIFAIDPNEVKDQFTAQLNSSNTNEILASCPFFVSPIIYQISAEVSVESLTTYYNTIAITV